MSVTNEIKKEDRRYIADLHFEHMVWINQLKFFKDEISILENRLGEVSIRYTKSEVKAQVERFQNQFIREREVIDTLVHDINAHEHNLSEYAKDHPIAVDHVYFKNHSGLEDRMKMFGKIWFELKGEFMNFLRNWM